MKKLSRTKAIALAEDVVSIVRGGDCYSIRMPSDYGAPRMMPTDHPCGAYSLIGSRRMLRDQRAYAALIFMGHPEDAAARAIEALGDFSGDLHAMMRALTT